MLEGAGLSVLCAACAALAAALLTALVRQRALAKGALDIPNARSSHSVPTPRGGGIAIVIVVSAVSAALAARGRIDLPLLMALLGGLLVAALGFIDDRRHLHAGGRFIVHVLAALWALYWLGGLPPVQLGHALVESRTAGYVFGVVGIVWVLNLFNFMDGIDGLAASEAVFISGAGALLALFGPGENAVWLAAIVVAAACCGFLCWNWPPAKIFLGDVGSGYLGYLVAVLAVAATRSDPAALCAWLTLGALFWADATVTLVRRVARGESPHVAHRSHAYQHLARRFGQHRRVTVLSIVVNVLWLFPLALYAEWHPRRALLCTLVALAPMLALVWWCGAGRAERADA